MSSAGKEQFKFKRHLASSLGQFFASITAGEKIRPGIDCKRMCTILAKIELKNIKGIRLVTTPLILYCNPGI